MILAIHLAQSTTCEAVGFPLLGSIAIHTPTFFNQNKKPTPKCQLKILRRLKPNAAAIIAQPPLINATTTCTFPFCLSEIDLLMFLIEYHVNERCIVRL